MSPKEIRTQLIQGLKKKKFKLTPQRLQILDILSQAKTHPSALDIFAIARKRIPGISLSTVYYTLDILKKEGLIKELEFYDRDNRYEGDISDHLNLVCKGCGKIEDFKARLPVPSELVEKKAGFKVDGVRFEYYGYCEECQKKKH
jgi:Fe2+ or Zn2+ uptake regulation protein